MELTLTRSRSGNAVEKSIQNRRPGLVKQTIILIRRAHLNVYRNWVRSTNPYFYLFHGLISFANRGVRQTQLIGFSVQAIVIGLLMVSLLLRFALILVMFTGGFSLPL